MTSNRRWRQQSCRPASNLNDLSHLWKILSTIFSFCSRNWDYETWSIFLISIDCYCLFEHGNISFPEIISVMGVWMRCSHGGSGNGDWGIYFKYSFEMALGTDAGSFRCWTILHKICINQSVKVLYLDPGPCRARCARLWARAHENSDVSTYVTTSAVTRERTPLIAAKLVTSLEICTAIGWQRVPASHSTATAIGWRQTLDVTTFRAPLCPLSLI